MFYFNPDVDFWGDVLAECAPKLERNTLGISQFSIGINR